jgi:hypothetical protein
LLTHAEAEGTDIPVVVPMQNLTPRVPEAAGGAPEHMEVVVEEAATATGGEEATTPPEPALEVVVRPGDPRRGAHPLCADDGSRHK